MKNGDTMSTTVNSEINIKNDCCGYLLKRKKHIHKWKKQYFRIHENNILYSNTQKVL